MTGSKKYLYIILCTVVLLLLVVFAVTKERPALPQFVIQNPDSSSSQTISVFDDENGNYYVFLPSYTEMAQVTVSFLQGQAFSLDNIPLSEGMACDHFSIETPYTISANGSKLGTLWFYCSKNIGSMYIETDSGSMNYIHSNKGNQENASVTLYAADGSVNYQSTTNTIQGRGNATWNREKRPYSLTLSADSSLLGMGSASNWVLLANAYDETNLNNKLIFDLAAQAGLPWSPDSRWVDLYLNGEYNGVYLLTEKVEVQENRLPLDTSSGSFLCKIDLNERFDSLRSPFLTNANRAVEIVTPLINIAQEAATIQQLVQQMEQALLSGNDLSNSPLIDLDSWVRRYLIDEISGNIDADLASSYFYYDQGKFYAGPVWDYDMALGNNSRNQNPQAFIAKNGQKADAFYSPYYEALYANPSFYSCMTQLYETQFKPLLEQLVYETIDQQAAKIQKASQMNSLRWRTMFDKLQDRNPGAVHTVEGIKDYLSQRIAFLDSAWLDGEAYCTIQFATAPTEKYQSISVKKGDLLETTDLDIHNTIWINTATGQAFDFTQPITQDVILMMQDGKAPLETAEYITYLSVAAFLVLLVVFAIIDGIHRRKERRCADGQ